MIEVTDLTKRYGPVTAVDRVSFRLEAGQTLALIGRSGCGKTTLLKLLNRLLEPDSGQIRIQGKDIRADPGHLLRRRLGYVIQHTGLFPHRTVAQNIATVPQLLGWPPARIRRRTEQLLERVGLPFDRFAGQFPAQLSGGQQQRVGLARALAADPPIVLMDEPFGALDPLTRRQLRRDFKQLEELRDKTIIIVTHDTAEAFELGDFVALMDAGRIVQCAPPAALLYAPTTELVRRFLASQHFALSLLVVTLAELAAFLPVADVTGPTLAPTLTLEAALERLAEQRRPHVVMAPAGARRVSEADLLRALSAWLDAGSKTPTA